MALDPTETSAVRPPLKPLSETFNEEIEQAVVHLRRPWLGLILSGAIAGFGMGASLLLTAAVYGFSHELPDWGFALLVANAYTAGFILVILANSDLFTEYTTIALLPVLSGDASWSSLCRLWVLVYVSNLVGGAIFCVLAVPLIPALDIAEAAVLVEIARELFGFSAWVIFLSASLAGWFMGLLSWLIAAARATISQIFFIWLIAFLIGIGNLHHVVFGFIKLFAGIVTGAGDLSVAAAAHVVVWTTLGNIAGGAVFACLIRFSVLISRPQTNKTRKKAKPD